MAGSRPWPHGVQLCQSNDSIGQNHGFICLMWGYLIPAVPTWHWPSPATPFPQRSHAVNCFVCDNAGTGTTALLSPAGQDCDPQFGRRSRAAHRFAGIHELLEVPLTTVRRDIDTAADLWDAQRLGLGAHSQAVLNEAR